MRQMHEKPNPSTKRERTRELHLDPLPLSPLPPSLLTYIHGLLPAFVPSALIGRRMLGYYENVSRTVHVPAENDMVFLWRRGFFGKGSLSRSEPTWLSRQHGLAARLTAEQITVQRRQERRATKIQKMRDRQAERLGPSDEAVTFNPSRSADVSRSPSGATILPATFVMQHEIKQPEHLQLEHEEVLFLTFAIGSLSVHKDSLRLSVGELWLLFLKGGLEQPMDSVCIRPSNPFIISYVVYHHFRSLGWVVRNGIKFCVDWVLYKGSDGTGAGGAGPVGGHAEYAALTYLHFEDPSDMTAEIADVQHERSDWRFINTVNRVCAGVKKTLLLVYVTVPSQSRCTPAMIAHGPDSCVQCYSVREVIVGRFVPTRMRD